MFAYGKVIKLEWSIHGQRGGSSAHGIDIPGCSPASNRGYHENSQTSCPQFQALVSWGDRLKLDRQGLCGFHCVCVQ